MAFQALIVDIVRTLRWRVPFLVVLTFLVAATEGLAIAALLPLLSVLGLGDGEGGRVAEISRAALDWLGLPFTLGSVSLVLGTLIAISAVLFLAQARLATMLQARYVAQWQRRLAEALVAARWTHLRGLARGGLASAITVDAPRVGAAFYQANLITTACMFIVAQSLIALFLAPFATAILVAFGGCLFLLTRALASRAAEDGRALTTANGQLLGRVGEIASALKLVKATASESSAVTQIGDSIARIERASARAAFDVQITRAVFEYGGATAIILLLAFGPRFGAIDVASTIIVVALFVRLFPKITALRQSLQSITVVLPSFEICTSIEDAARSAAESTCFHDTHTDRSRGAASLELLDVEVRSPEGRALVHDVNIRISAGEYVAIVGPSGAGKTTLLDLLIGLIEATRGTVLVDGEPLGPERLQGWRRKIGYLGQEPIAFTGTIAENVSWGRPSLDRDQVRAALLAAAAERIRTDLDELIGEGGVALSGGERQRLALARALAGEPRLVVLDEATSALDSQTESRVLDTLRTLRGTVTILVVSHRLWSVRDADRIIVVENGTVRQEGSFEELSMRSGWFRDALNGQED